MTLTVVQAEWRTVKEGVFGGPRILKVRRVVQEVVLHFYGVFITHVFHEVSCFSKP